MNVEPREQYAYPRIKPLSRDNRYVLVARWRALDLRFHDLRHTFVTRKVREGWDYKRIMAITGHKTFAVFQRYNNPSEEDIKAVVLENPLKKMVG